MEIRTFYVDLDANGVLTVEGAENISISDENGSDGAEGIRVYARRSDDRMALYFGYGSWFDASQVTEIQVRTGDNGDVIQRL